MQFYPCACGHANFDDMKYCSHCGRRVIVPEPKEPIARKVRKITPDDRRAILPEIQRLEGYSPAGYIDRISMELCRRIGILWTNPTDDVIAAATEMAKPFIERDRMQQIVDKLKG